MEQTRDLASLIYNSTPSRRKRLPLARRALHRRMPSRHVWRRTCLSRCRSGSLAAKRVTRSRTPIDHDALRVKWKTRRCWRACGACLSLDRREVDAEGQAYEEEGEGFEDLEDDEDGANGAGGAEAEVPYGRSQTCSSGPQGGSRRCAREEEGSTRGQIRRKLLGRRGRRRGEDGPSTTSRRPKWPSKRL